MVKFICTLTIPSGMDEEEELYRRIFPTPGRLGLYVHPILCWFFLLSNHIHKFLFDGNPWQDTAGDISHRIRVNLCMYFFPLSPINCFCLGYMEKIFGCILPWLQKKLFRVNIWGNVDHLPPFSFSPLVLLFLRYFSFGMHYPIYQHKLYDYGG